MLWRYDGGAVSCELVAQAEFILLVAIRQNDCRLDSAFSVILKAMEICEGFPFLRGPQKRLLLRDLLERLVARRDDGTSNAAPLLPESTMVALRQTLERDGVEHVARAVVDVSKGRVRVNPVYAGGEAPGPEPPRGAPSCFGGLIGFLPRVIDVVRTKIYPELSNRHGHLRRLR